MLQLSEISGLKTGRLFQDMAPELNGWTRTKSAPLFARSYQSEIHLDGCRYRHWLAVFRRWLKSPVTDCLDGFLI